LDPNKRCAPSLPRSGGLLQQWRQSCFNKTLKMINSIIDECDTHFTTPLIFFSVFTLQALSAGSYQRLVTFLSRSKGHKQASWSPSLENLQKPSLLQNHHWEISIGIELTAMKYTLEPSHFDQRAKFWSIYIWTY
jgi:hypothetical protein